MWLRWVMIEIHLCSFWGNYRLSPVDLKSSLEHGLVESGCARRGTSSKIQKRFDSDGGRILVELKYLFLWSGDELGGTTPITLLIQKKNRRYSILLNDILYSAFTVEMS